MKYTRFGWLKNLISVIEAPIPTEEKVQFIEAYVDWCEDEIYDDMPSCDDCERIHPDDIGACIFYGSKLTFSARQFFYDDPLILIGNIDDQ